MLSCTIEIFQIFDSYNLLTDCTNIQEALSVSKFGKFVLFCSIRLEEKHDESDELDDEEKEDKDKDQRGRSKVKKKKKHKKHKHKHSYKSASRSKSRSRSESRSRYRSRSRQ